MIPCDGFQHHIPFSYILEAAYEYSIFQQWMNDNIGIYGDSWIGLFDPITNKFCVSFKHNQDFIAFKLRWVENKK